MFISTIIVAGGRGKRFGGKKQYYKLKGKPVVLWPVEKFAAVSDEVILVLPAEDAEAFRKKWGSKYRSLKITAGGKERWQSVEAGLRNISTKAGRQAGLVAIHDGARPLVSRRDILACFAAAKKHGAAICAARASDTVKISDGEHNILRTEDREHVFLAQTPQVFRREVILEAFTKWNKALSLNAAKAGRKFRDFAPCSTDDARMVEVLGRKVKLVETTSPNIKITAKTDLAIAEKLHNLKRGSY
ncbi:MAG: 2-C-methyl-D-erythritol 4-phosphate cytidylyltransferase [Elusimicrobia bacterium RIFOXYB2_FULL_48_7]|nr:MAG: 2-C-methyl-D-erythritol 4-phosphate cytidylyltransferase [Elusimicrobia bacterium RIFOXYB2_FULL_48_7]